MRHLWGTDILRERMWKIISDRVTGAFNTVNQTLESVTGKGSMLRAGIREASYVVDHGGYFHQGYFPCI